MPQKGSEREAAQEALRGAARALFISGDAIGAFLASATPGQVAACTAMLESEIARRDRAKRARPLGRARFPVPKSVEGFDWPDVAFPDGWGRDEMPSPAFARDAEDLVFHGQRSSRTMSSKSTSEQPPTCQGPVRPGLTARRCMAHSSYSATSSGSGGLGPTTDIPFVKTKKQDYLQKYSD